MGIKPEFRWWILTVVAVAVLLLISALALDRSNVVWRQGIAHCPHCRSFVKRFSDRCETCREQYDWTVAPDEESPISRWSLSALEADWLQERVEALGEDKAIRRVAVALDIRPAAAKEYLGQVGQGRCGWCGGTKIDLTSVDLEEPRPCAVCFGSGLCIACNGDRRIRVGDESAHRAFGVYVEEMLDLSDRVALALRRDEARRTTRTFLERHAGTREAGLVAFWPAWTTRHARPEGWPESIPADGEALRTPLAVSRSRSRLDTVLGVLASE